MWLWFWVSVLQALLFASIAKMFSGESWLVFAYVFAACLAAWMNGWTDAKRHELQKGRPVSEPPPE